MGCDMSLMVEKKVDGRWIKYEQGGFNGSGRNANTPFDWRCYAIFSFLADVRQRDDITPISSPKGLPNDSEYLNEDLSNPYSLDYGYISTGTCYTKGDEIEKDIDHHSFSFLTIRELMDFDYGRMATDKETYREYLGEDFFCDLGTLIEIGNPDEVRIVFWFCGYMKVSVIIPVHNDLDYLDQTIYSLLWEEDGVDLEIIVINDGSIRQDGSPLEMKNWWGYPEIISVFNNDKCYGIGYAFDRGVELAQGEIIILSGADVLPKGRKCLKSLIETLKMNPDSILCCTTLGLSPDNLDLDSPNDRYYGADLVWKYAGYNEKYVSKILRTDGHYTQIIKGQWRKTKDGEEPYEVPCLLGAFYACSKEFYTRIGGFDTVKGELWQGHKKWGHLEPMLSLKARVYGGNTMIVPSVEVGHIFNRAVDGVRSKDYQIWNSLWIAETMLTERCRVELYSFLKAEHNLSVAQKWIQQNKSTVLKVRDRNEREGKLIDNLN